jgi:hypothetical protein
VTITGGNILYGAFKNCNNITTIVLPNVSAIGQYAFDGCSSLTEVYIPKSVMTVGGYAFRGCSGLTSVTINKNCVYDFIGGDGFPDSVEIHFYEEE